MCFIIYLNLKFKYKNYLFKQLFLIENFKLWLLKKLFIKRKLFLIKL